MCHLLRDSQLPRGCADVPSSGSSMSRCRQANRQEDMQRSQCLRTGSRASHAYAIGVDGLAHGRGFMCGGPRPSSTSMVFMLVNRQSRAAPLPGPASYLVVAWRDEGCLEGCPLRIYATAADSASRVSNRPNCQQKWAAPATCAQARSCLRRSAEPLPEKARRSGMGEL